MKSLSILASLSCGLLLLATPGRAQTAAKVAIALDPAHGGPDPGAHLAPNSAEKDANLAFARKLKALLVAQEFTVVLTRDTDEAEALSGDQRAEIANHAHPIACLAIHATATGRGVHLFTSSLIPLTIVDEIKPVQPWETAQAASIAQSLRLVNELASSFNSARVPLVIGRASIPPIDSLAYPAVVLEIAPMIGDDGKATPASDEAYQQMVAEAVSNALITWRGHVQQAAEAAAAAAEAK